MLLSNDPQAQRRGPTRATAPPRYRSLLAPVLLLAVLAAAVAARDAWGACDPDTVSVYLKTCDPATPLAECETLARQPTDFAQGQPVLFVHGHDLIEDGTPHFRRNWQKKGLLFQPSFRDALVDPRNRHLDLEPYYLHLEDQHRSIADDACAVAGAIRRILRRHGDPDAKRVKVAIIANSKGTISSRLYLKSLEEEVPGFPAPKSDPEDRFRPVSEFVAIATPNHGLALDPEDEPKLYCSLALRQLNNGVGVDQGCTPICRPSLSFCSLSYPACRCNENCQPDSVGFFGTLNGGDEAPGSRSPWAPQSDGILYLTLYADRQRDIVGGSGESGDLCGRRQAKNLSPDAVNVEVPEVLGNVGLVVHGNTVHTPQVICKALYTVAHHRPPPANPCGNLVPIEVPHIPSEAADVPADVVLLLDTSGSMGWHARGNECDLRGGCCSRLASAKAAARHFVNLLKDYASSETRIGVAIFPGMSAPSQQFTPTSGLAGDPASFDAIAAASCSATGTPCIGGESVLCQDGAGQSLCTGNAQCPGSTGTPTGIPVNWNGTPTRLGLEKAFKILKTASKHGDRARVVVLLSDGAWNWGGDPADPAFLADLRDEGIRVYTLAMGTGEDNFNEASLQSISTGTGVGNGSAVFNLGESDEALRKVFERILSEVVPEVDFNLDPEGSLRLGDVNPHPIAVTDDDRRMSFTVSSPRIDLLDVRVVAPDGQEILPRSFGGSKIVDVGEDLLRPGSPGHGWQLVVSYPRPSGVPKPPKELPYTYSVLTRSSLNLGLRLDKANPQTGDDLLIEARLTREGRPLRSASVELEVRRPASAIGDWHHAHRVAEDQLATVPDEISGEPLSRLDKKLFLLRKQASESPKAKRKLTLPEYVTHGGIVLNDLGQDGDRRAGDGVYSVVLANLAVPGVWDFRVVASGTTDDGQDFRRERTVQKLVGMTPDPARSDVEGAIERVRLDGSGTLRLSVTPRDAAGNYLGPGYLDEVEITITPAPPTGPEKKDLLYGAYQARFEADDVTAEANVVLKARGVTLYDGPFSELRKPAFRWAVSGHLGATEPRGLLNGNRNGSLSLRASLAYHVSRSWSAELLLGRHSFSGQAGASDLDVVAVSVNGRYSVPLGVVRVFGNAGFGYYDPDTGGSGGGWNVGGGVSYPFDERSSLEWGFDRHQMERGAKLEFLTFHLGYRWAF